MDLALSLPIDPAAARSWIGNVRAAHLPVMALEAYWGSEPGGLYLALVAIIEQPSWRHGRFTAVDLARLPAGRTHTGPSWPESACIAEAGDHLSHELGVPFHFASRDRPRDEVVRWWDLGHGRPCDDCGLELDQNPAVHWFGMCYSCHLAREDRQARVHIDLLRDVDRCEYERIRGLVDASLHAARSGGFYAGSRVPGAQSLSFLSADAHRAAEIAVITLRDAGLVDHLQVRAARSVTHEGDVLWPPRRR